ncbi:hypothetical protein [Nitratiruptor sp. YY09-18]|uniref:hypothetical protein n=1 Tax=Nitratiruptor sp. YY09-18 TaxID=2724901 RepID=UPI0019160723|nr:hypothetical protein [Nitratiruptor sp. YY09-18]BCD67686.1 hypothetical protein NitYY0918_C0587 [Nitratiruptor sp. YY09-18]
MKHYLIILLSIIVLLSGCASKATIEKELQKSEKVVICNTILPLQTHENRPSELLHRFPFVSLKKNYDIRGKFDRKFYESINFVYNAKNIKDVDFWQLRNEPKLVDFIYVLPLWIKDYRKLTSDVMSNIAYSYNISAQEQKILRSWVEKGGVLWVEFGIFSTKYDIFTKSGEINTKKINYLIKNGFRGLKFWGSPLKNYLFQSKSIDFLNYVSSSQSFVVNQKRSLIKGIARLRLNLDNYLENFMILDGKPLLVDQKGKPLVTMKRYGKGAVVTLLPFEYQDAYYDGELLRWKLLYYFLNR